MIAALILAAGSSSRMGRPKQLLAFRGRSLLRRTIDAASEGGCRRVIVVLGAHAELVRSECDLLPAEICINENWRQGLAESIRCGISLLRAHGERPRAALLMACDQPLVSGALVSRLCDAFDDTPGRMVACEYAGTVGVPALFGNECFDRLAALRGDEGAKSVLLGDSGMLRRLPWPEGAQDIDTFEDYAKLG